MGIQTEGGDQNVTVKGNDISGCGAGIAFAAPVTGPLYIEANTIHNLSTGLYDNLSCFKVGNTGGGTSYLTDNVCDVDSAAEVAGGGADGIHQTNEGLAPIVSRGNVLHVSRYVFEVTEGANPADLQGDCLWTVDPDRFVKWAGGQRYDSLVQFQQATGQEGGGHESLDCSFLDRTPAPTPSPTASATPTPQPSPPGPTVTPTPIPSPTSTPVPNVCRVIAQLRPEVRWVAKWLCRQRP